MTSHGADRLPFACKPSDSLHLRPVNTAQREKGAGDEVCKGAYSPMSMTLPYEIRTRERFSVREDRNRPTLSALLDQRRTEQFRQAFPTHAWRAANDRVGARPNKYKTNGPRHGRSRITISADKKQSRARLDHGEAKQLTVILSDGVHCDLQKFAERLVEVLKAQRWSNLGRAGVRT